MLRWQGRRANISCVQGNGSRRGSSGPYFLGSKPSSIDALLFGHLALHLTSPAIPEQLSGKVQAPLPAGMTCRLCYVITGMQSMVV